MRLASFITDNLDAILVDWVAFAREQLPAAANLDETALLDHGKLILQEIAADMRRPQDDDERQAKSEGDSGGASTSAQVPSRSHARQRERQGFQVEQLVAEYRALRATVLRLWTAASSSVQVEDLEDITRFNEAVDQAIAESLQVFVAEVDKARDLFLGMLGHDLRGPLSTIASSAAVEMRLRPNDSPRATIILRSVAQMKALLDDLVEYTRHRLGSGLAIAPAALRLDHFARNTLDEIEAISRGSVIELEVAGNLEGEWDARRLHQALRTWSSTRSNMGFRALPSASVSTVRAKTKLYSRFRTVDVRSRRTCCQRCSIRWFARRARTRERTRRSRVRTWAWASMSCARSPRHTGEALQSLRTTRRRASSSGCRVYACGQVLQCDECNCPRPSNR